MQTGPITAAGKAISSINATKHGLTSQKVILPGEDSAEFQELLDTLVAEHRPGSPTESLLIDEMAQARWRLDRVRRKQDQAFSADMLDQKLLALLLRYGATYERSFYKALETLKKLQREARSPFVSQKAEQDNFFRQLDAAKFLQGREPRTFRAHSGPQFRRSAPLQVKAQLGVELALQFSAAHQRPKPNGSATPN